MNADTIDFDRQLRTLITRSSGRHLDISDRLQELGSRMSALDVAQGRVLDMLTPIAPAAVPLKDESAQATTASSSSTSAPSFASYGEPWSTSPSHPHQAPNFSYPEDEQIEPLPRIAQAIHRELNERRG